MPEKAKKNSLYSIIRKQWLPTLLLLILLWPATCKGNNLLGDAWQEITQVPEASIQFLEPALDHFIRKQQQSQVKNATIYSLALLEMAARPNLKDDVKSLLTTASIAISPDYSFPETALCKLLFKQQHYLKSWFSLVRAGKKIRINSQENLYASTFFWLAAAFIPLALFFLVTLLMTIRYYRTFCEMGRIKLNRPGNFALLAITAAAALIVIMIPAPLLGLLLLAGGISLLTTRRDAITSALLLSTLLIVPLAYEKGMTSLLALDSSFLKAARHTTSGLYDETDQPLLREPATNQSQLVLQLFSQAEAARLRKKYAKAGIFLEKIIHDKIELGAVYNNLANLYLLQGRPEKTEDLYALASKLEKTSGIPYYNLSQTYIRQSFDLEKSSQALEQALKLSPDLNQSTIGHRDNLELEQPDNMELIFMALPKNFYRRYADSQPEKEIFIPAFLRRILFPGAGSGIYFAIILLSLGGLLYQIKRAPANRRVCTLCGRLFYPTRKQKEKNCPACRLSNQPTITTLLGNFEPQPDDPGNRPLTLMLAAGGILLPGFYPFIIGNMFIAIGLLLPTLLWFYNLLIIQTGIMEPFPPSTTWLTLILPILIWSINLVILVLMHHQQQRQNSSRSNP
ncbi:MAG: tetratricopeptide repeat protein [Deltaproteobacteria bacterium]|nr:tetratricopeptide repeat protein [Deltaproteobacteria bacterium]